MSGCSERKVLIISWSQVRASEALSQPDLLVGFELSLVQIPGLGGFLLFPPGSDGRAAPTHKPVKSLFILEIKQRLTCRQIQKFPIRFTGNLMLG